MMIKQTSKKTNELEESSPIYLFFKEMINNKNEYMERDLPFKLNVSHYRR